VFCQSFWVRAIGERGGAHSGNDFKKFRKNFPICLGKLLKQNHRPAKLSYSFSSQQHKHLGESKILVPPKAKGSRMPLVRAEYHGLLRRVAERGNQGRKVGAGAPNDCGERRTVPTISQALHCSKFASEIPQVRT